MAEHRDFFSLKTRHTADESGIVAEKAVAVDLAPVGENAFDVIERIRTLRVARQLGLLPGIHLRMELLA